MSRATTVRCTVPLKLTAYWVEFTLTPRGTWIAITSGPPSTSAEGQTLTTAFRALAAKLPNKGAKAIRQPKVKSRYDLIRGKNII